MKTNEGKSQKPVSMPVIILACICLGAAVFLMLQPSGSGISVENTKVEATPGKAETASSEIAVADGVNETEKNITISERDPFMPSQLFVTRSKKESVPQEPVAQKGVNPVGPSGSASDKITEVKEDEPMMWKGVVGTKDNLVVLIRRNNKTHLLRLGDLVPGTQYMVAQIATDSVLLVSPGQQLRLSKGGKR